MHIDPFVRADTLVPLCTYRSAPLHMGRLGRPRIAFFERLKRTFRRILSLEAVAATHDAAVCGGVNLMFFRLHLRVLHAAIVDNSLHFVKNFSRFVLKGLATHVCNSLPFRTPNTTRTNPTL